MQRDLSRPSATLPKGEGHSFAEAFKVPFKEAIEFLLQKISLPSATWLDIKGRAHDRAFVVAGATKMALLEDIRNAMQRGIEGKLTLQQWSKEFEAIVAKHGWTGWTGEGTAAGRAWRARVIFQTNMRTAYAAGRYAQMTDPDVTDYYKYWRYRHAFYRVPEKARPEHELVFDGRVLPWNDPWWDTHYPPNGWHCSCGVEQLTQDDVDDEKLTVEHNPVMATRQVRDPLTGDIHEVPRGIDYGWDHAPGKDWARGLVPKELQHDVPLQLPLIPLPLEPLLKSAKPFKYPLLDKDVDPRVAVGRFLTEFGASWEQPKIWRDPSGHAIAISKDLFLDAKGEVKFTKGHRQIHMLRLAETLTDPDEIWIDFEWHHDTKRWNLKRRYLKIDPETAAFSAFTWSNKAWVGNTVFPAAGKSGKPRHDYIEGYRKGALLWRRDTK